MLVENVNNFFLHFVILFTKRLFATVFSEISEKDFILKKSELEGKLKELKKKKPTSVKRIDDDFLKLASYFLVNNEFLNKRKINYRTIGSVVVLVK